MKRAILLATVIAAFAVAGAAFGYASDPNSVTWSYDFESQAIGTSAYLMTGWTGSSDGGDPPGLSNYSVQLDGTNQVLARTAAAADTTWRYAWSGQVIGGHLSLGLDTTEIQILHVLMKKGTSSGTNMNNWFGLVDTDGNYIGGWRQNGTAWQARVFGAGHAATFSGTQTNFADSNWHDFDMVFHQSTGLVEWYYDGVLNASWTNAGMAEHFAGAVQFDSKSNVGDTFFFDDIKVGTFVPEPSSLVALSAFAVGALGFIRRRRA